MHETYRLLTQSRIEDRLREAAEWRRAEEAGGRSTRRGPYGRVRALVARGRNRRQPAAPATAVLAVDGTGCA